MIINKKKNLFRLTAIILILSLFTGILAGCDREEASNVPDEEGFDQLMDELFADWVSNDTLTMNYFLANPESLGIERPEPTYGDVVDQEMIDKSKEETEELAERLEGFDYDSLRDDQKIVYDILERSIVLYRIMERNDDYSYYTGYIRPLNGIQVQLPVLLAEFNFFTSEDIQRYLDLLGDTHRYFNDIIEFERERSRRGYFLSEANVDSVIEQIESYLENREDNLLITVFDDRIDNYEGLNDEQRERYKQSNRELVLGNVLAAYDTLLEAMNELRGVGANTGGLADLPGGREFAHAHLQLRVGTDRTAADLSSILEDWVRGIWANVMTALHGNPVLMEGFVNESLGQITDGTPEEYISMLQRRILEDFPPIAPTQLEIFEVHESLQEHMSPAFYLAPAVDRFNDNIVYVNPSSIDDNMFLFTVLAHESYPGHMYQTVYFLQQSPHPVRTALSNTGYSEGWATYAEMTGYYYTDVNVLEAELLWNFRFFDMLLVSYIDMGVNVMGWSHQDVARRLLDFNIQGEVVDNIYDRVTGIPLNSLLYTLGYIELNALMQDVERVLGDDFDLFEFHRYFLDFGPAPYPVIRKHLNERIVTDPSTALAPAA